MEHTEITDDQIRAINARAMQVIAADKDARIDDLQRALDAERTAKKAYQSTVVDLRKQLATLQAQLRQVEGDRQTLRQLVAALPVVEVDGVIVWAAPDESGWFVSKRPAPTGTYWAKFKTQEDAKSFLALLKSRATLAAQDAGQGGLQ